MTSKMDFVLMLLLIAPHVYATELHLGGKVFIQYHNLMAWGDAQTYCRQHHTDLVTISDSTENSYLSQYDFYGWIGLYHDTSTSQWKWSAGDQDLFRSWFWSTTAGQCTFKYSSDYWDTMNCDDTHSFICYEMSLVLVKEEKTWEEALAHCRSIEVIDPTAYRNHSHDLVSIVTQDDYTLAHKMKQQATTQQVWTGLRFLGDQWMWVDGEEVEYTNPNPCPDNSRCGALDKTSTDLYVLKECKNKYNFFCYKNPLRI